MSMSLPPKHRELALPMFKRPFFPTPPGLVWPGVSMRDVFALHFACAQTAGGSPEYRANLMIEAVRDADLLIEALNKTGEKLAITHDRALPVSEPPTVIEHDRQANQERR
jgi:hypothetical protein